MLFKNREEAAQLLAHALSYYKDKNPLILAIPRGAVPMAKIIAEDLNGEMDVVLVHKIGAPYQEELAIGAVDESGAIYVNPYAQQIAKSYVKQEAAQQLSIIRQRRRQYTKTRPPISPEGRIVIVVDDGIATGATMMAALASLRAKNPKQLIAAIPVGPLDTLIELESHADAVVYLEAPLDFQAVGQFYQAFPPVTDEEIIKILTR